MPTVYRVEHTYTHKVKVVFGRTYEPGGRQMDGEDAQALQQRIHWLEEQMDRLEELEPEDIAGEAYDKWQERMDELQEQIEEIQELLDELEE